MAYRSTASHLPIATLSGSVRAFRTQKNGNHRGKLRSSLLKSGVVKVRQLGFLVRRKGEEREREREGGNEARGMRPFSCLFFSLFFLSLSPLDGRVRLLVLLGVFDVRTAVHVFGARVYRILLATLRHLLVDDTRVLVILVVFVAGRDVRLTSGADVTRSLLVAATPRCNKQRHDRSRQMCVCGYSIFLSCFFSPFLRLFSSRTLYEDARSPLASIIERRLSCRRIDIVRVSVCRANVFLYISQLSEYFAPARTVIYISLYKISRSVKLLAGPRDGEARDINL